MRTVGRAGPEFATSTHLTSHSASNLQAQIHSEWFAPTHTARKKGLVIGWNNDRDFHSRLT